MKNRLFILAFLTLFCVTLSACGCMHKWDDATCSAPQTCSRCGETSGEALEHDWQDATCNAPETCSLCGEERGEALKHTLNSEGCCKVCGEKVGIPLTKSNYDRYITLTLTEDVDVEELSNYANDKYYLPVANIYLTAELKEGYEWYNIIFFDCNLLTNASNWGNTILTQSNPLTPKDPTSMNPSPNAVDYDRDRPLYCKTVAEAMQYDPPNYRFEIREIYGYVLEEDPAKTAAREEGKHTDIFAAEAYLRKIWSYQRKLEIEKSNPKDGIYAFIAEYEMYPTRTSEGIYSTQLGWYKDSTAHHRTLLDDTLVFAKAVDLNHDGVPELITGESEGPSIRIKCWRFDGHRVSQINEDYVLTGIYGESCDDETFTLSILKGKDQDYIYYSLNAVDSGEYEFDSYTGADGTTSIEDCLYDYDPSENWYRVNSKDVTAQEATQARANAPKGSTELLIQSCVPTMQAEEQFSIGRESHLRIYPLEFHFDPFEETQKTIAYLEELSEKPIS